MDVTRSFIIKGLILSCLVTPLVVLATVVAFSQLTVHDTAEPAHKNGRTDKELIAAYVSAANRSIPIDAKNFQLMKRAQPTTHWYVAELLDTAAPKDSDDTQVRFVAYDYGDALVGVVVNGGGEGYSFPANVPKTVRKAFLELK